MPVLLNNSIYYYLAPFLMALFLSLFLTPVFKNLAVKWKLFDAPDEVRKVHKNTVPLLGGWAVIASSLLIGTYAWNRGWLTDARIDDQKILAVFIGAALIAIGGYLDDRFRLKPWQQIIWPVAAAVVVVAMGVKVGFITNPFEAGSGPYGRSLFYIGSSAGIIFSFLWLMGMMYTVKFLDGLDGLVAGVGSIGALILFFVSLFWDVPLSGTSVLSLILAGSLLGFLVYNWHPAKVFLGESSLYVGFMLGVLSIISGAKIATALLIVGIPVLDVVWVVFRRMFREHRSPFRGDRKHLHHRLFDIGLSHRQVVLLFYFITALFGTSSIFLQSQQKVMALIILILFMIILGIVLVKRYNKQNQLSSR